MVTPFEFGLLALLTTGTGLLSAYIVYLVIKPKLKATIRGYIPTFSRVIQTEMSKMAENALEGVDLGAIAGQLGGGEGEGNPLAAISGVLGGGGGGIEDILKLLLTFSGKQTTKGKGKIGL